MSPSPVSSRFQGFQAGGEGACLLVERLDWHVADPDAGIAVFALQADVACGGQFS